MPITPESLSPYIRRMNLAEKDELGKLGQKVDTFGEIKKQTTRRKFLEIAGQVLIAPILLYRQENPVETFIHRLEFLNNWVNVDRQDVNLVLETRNILLEATATESNDRYSRFEEHTLPSPFVMEGSYTLFGESSISLGQFLIYTDQLREQINNNLNIDQLSRSDQRILRIRNAYDQTDHTTIPIESTEFAVFFRNFLQNYRDEEIAEGFIGAVAAKSPSDFGRVGYVRVWDWVAEQWSQPGMTIVLNTANGQTLRNLADRRIAFENYDAEMRWGLEVSDEVLANLNLAPNRADNLSGYFQFKDSDAIPENTELQFPQYNKLLAEINSSSYQFAEELGTILNLESLSEEIINTYQAVSASLQEDSEASFSFEAGEYTLLQAFNQSSIISYIFHNHGIPIVLDPNRAEIINSLNTPSLGLGGFPLGKNNQHFLLNYFTRPYLFEKKILCNTRQDDLSSLHTAIFFFENYPDMLGSQIPLLNGFVVTYENQKRFIYLDENNQVMNKSIDEMSDFFHEDLNKRIIIFVPTNLNVRDFNHRLSHV